MARRTKQEAEKTREALLDAAELVFLRHGVGKATLEEIAREAGVTRGAVYWHFENKIAIMRAMHERMKLPLDTMFDQLLDGPDVLNRLKAACLYVLKALVEDAHVRNVCTILRLRWEDINCAESEFACEMQKKHDEVIARFTRIFSQIEKEQALAEGLTPKVAAMALHTFFSGVFWDYLRQPSSYPLKKLAPQLVECFFRGVIAEKKR